MNFAGQYDCSKKSTEDPSDDWGSGSDISGSDIVVSAHPSKDGWHGLRFENSIHLGLPLLRNNQNWWRYPLLKKREKGAEKRGKTGG